jgi:hypothetical protein
MVIYPRRQNSSFNCTYGTIKRALKNRTRMNAEMKFYKTVAIRNDLCGCEVWVVTSKDKSGLEAAKIL